MATHTSAQPCGCDSGARWTCEEWLSGVRRPQFDKLLAIEELF